MRGCFPDGGYDDRTFWSDVLPGLLPDAAQQLGLTFDAIVVDEGQDFHANWWTALELLLADPDDGFFYVFADDNQNVYRADWEIPIRRVIRSRSTQLPQHDTDRRPGSGRCSTGRSPRLAWTVQLRRSSSCRTFARHRSGWPRSSSVSWARRACARIRS